MLTKERKKQLNTDLWIIAGVSLLVLVIYTVFGREINHIAADTANPIVLRVLFMGGIFQFGIAGLGITIAAMCILIHGVVGVTPDAVAEMLCTLFLIYGMLIVRKATGNAWGCILIFVFYWNAL